MAVSFQTRFIIAILALGTVSGCAGGIGHVWDDVASKTSALGHKNEQIASRVQPIVSTPEVTEQNFAQVQMALGDSLAKEGNFEVAKAAYEAAIRNDKTLARAYHRLALLHEKTGHDSNSKELFLKAIELDPKNAEIACDYGYWCYLRKDWDESQKQLQRALKLDPNSKRAHNNLGLLCARTNRPDDALKQFTLAGLSPADSRANLGFVYLTQDRIPEAKAELERAVSASPSSEKARNVLASLEKKVATTSEPKQLPSSTAIAPAEKPAIKQQTNLPPAKITKSPAHTAMAASESKTLPPALGEGIDFTASKPVAEITFRRPNDKHVLASRKAEPAPFDNPFKKTASEPSTEVELTEFSDRPPATLTVAGLEKKSLGGETTLRFLPPR